MNVLHTSALTLVAALAVSAVCAQEPALAPAAPAIPGEDFDPMALAAARDPHVQAVRAQRRISDLAKQYANTDKEEDKRKIRSQLTDLVNQQFEARMQQQEKALQKLEKEIADLRAVLKKRQEAKATIVDHRIDQLIQDAQGMGWSGMGGGESSFWYWNETPRIPTPPTPPATPGERK